MIQYTIRHRLFYNFKCQYVLPFEVYKPKPSRGFRMSADAPKYCNVTAGLLSVALAAAIRSKGDARSRSSFKSGHHKAGATPEALHRIATTEIAGFERRFL